MSQPAAADPPSVFSLELFVQHVEYFPQAAPAHPAVAFRLLDFPSVVIYSPSPEQSSVVNAAASSLAAKPNAVDIFNPANFSAHHVLSFERGKSCLFTLGRQSLQRLLQHVPLYLMLVDTITGLDQSALSASASTPAELPPAHLLGSTAVDLSEFAQQDAIPSRESSDGYRRGTFAFVDLMGNPIGRAHVILRLSSFGLSLLPHLGLLGANAGEHQPHSSGHSASSSVPPRAEAFAMAAPPAAAIPKAEQSQQQQHHQPHTAPPSAAATLPTLVDTVVQHATSVMRTTHQGDEATVEASRWVDPSEDRPPALFFCRVADGGGADEPVGAALTVLQANALAQPLPSPEAANADTASYLCWQNQPHSTPLADPSVVAQHHHQPAGSAETAPSSLTRVESNQHPAAHGSSTETDRITSALRTSASAHAPPPRRNSTPTKPAARPQSASVAAIKAAYSQSGAAPAAPKAKGGPAHAVKSGSQSRPSSSSSSSSSSRPAAPSSMLPSNNIAKHSFSAQQAPPPTKAALAWSIRDSRDFAASAASALATHGDAHHRGGKENQHRHHDHDHDHHEHDRQVYHSHYDSAEDQMQQPPRRSSATDAYKQPSESHAPHNHALNNASRKAPAVPHGDADFSAAVAGFFTQLTQLLVRVQSTLPPPAEASALAPADASHALAGPGAGTVTAHTALAMASHALSSAFAPGLQPPHAVAAANRISGNAANVASSQSQSQPSDAHLRRSILDALANEIAFVRSSEYAQMVRRNRLQQQLQQFASPLAADRLSTTSSMFDDHTGLAVDDWDDADSDASSIHDPETHPKGDPKGDPKAAPKSDHPKADPKAAAAQWARRSRDHQQRVRVRQWQREADRAPHRVIAASLAEIEREMRARDSTLPPRPTALAASTADVSAVAAGAGIGTVQAAANAAHGNAAAALSTDQLLSDFFRTSVQLQVSLMPSASQQPSLPADASAARQSSIAKSLVNVAAALREARMEQQAAKPTRADPKAASTAQTTAPIGSARSTAKPSAKPSPSAKSTVAASLSSSSASAGAAAASSAKVDSDRVRLHLSATDMTLGAPPLSNRYRDANANSNSNANANPTAASAVAVAVVTPATAAGSTSAAASVASASAVSTASSAAPTTTATTTATTAAAAAKKSRNISISSGSSLSYSSDRSYSDASFDTDRDSSSSSSPSSSRNASTRASVADPRKAASSAASASAASATTASSSSSSSSTTAPVASKLPARNSMLSAAALSSSSEYDTDFEK